MAATIGIGNNGLEAVFKHTCKEEGAEIPLLFQIQHLLRK